MMGSTPLFGALGYIVAIHWDEALRRLKVHEAVALETVKELYRENLVDGAFSRDRGSFKTLLRVKKEAQIARSAMLVCFAQHTVKNSHAWTAYQKPYFFTHRPLAELVKLKIPYALSDLELMACLVQSRDRVDDFRLGYSLDVLAAALRQFHKEGQEIDALPPMVAELKTLVEGLQWQGKAAFVSWAEELAAAAPAGFEFPNLLQRRICVQLLDALVTGGVEEARGRAFVLSLPDHEESRPTTRWRRATETFLGETDAKPVGESLAKALDYLASEVDRWNSLDWAGKYQGEVQILNTARSMGRGLFWAIGLTHQDPLVSRMLAAARPFTATDGANYFSGILFACAAGLGLNGSASALAALQKLRTSILNRTLARQVDRIIQEVATTRGAPAAELAETSVPTFDLSPAGTWTREAGAYTLRISISSSREVVLEIARGDARPSKTVPPELKKAHASEYQEARNRTREITQALGAQRERLERLMEEGRQVDVDVFRERYIAHVLVNLLSRFLIWETEDAQAFLGCDPTPRGTARVRLWHPARAKESEIESWRRTLVERRIVQPFRQAFREFYRPSAKEARGGSEVTRFASHVVDVPLVETLRSARAWAPHAPAAAGSASTSGTGSGDRGRRICRDSRIPGFRAILEWAPFIDARHARLERLRFVSAEGEVSVPIGEVDAVFFSETLRDLDHFAWVAAAGRQAMASARGASQRQWEDAFRTVEEEEPLESARVRRALLALEMPALALGKAVALEDRYLRIKGQLATYRIHLGTGTITLDPKGTVIPLDPERQPAPAGLFLPFEEPDARLTDVLNKARALLEDARIKEPAFKKAVHAAAA
jgi:hypothetical protein